MKIAIIGCGYVGKAIAQQWYQQGHELTVTTTTPEKVTQLEDIAHHVKIFRGDDLEGLKEICEGQDVILLSLGSQGRSEEQYRLSYVQTAQSLREALKNNHTVKQVIYTSSYSIVGNHDGAWVDENTPDQPANIFAEILLETEQILSSMENDDRHFCILRLGGIYGENREILKIFRNAMGETRPGNGLEYGNWVHLEDIVAGIQFAVRQKLSGLFNLVGDEPMQRKKMLDKLAEKYNLPPVIWDESQPSMRPFNVRVSNQKIKSRGFTFKYPVIQL
jgi:nucleoside-diphosphate-sugar epimerase